MVLEKHPVRFFWGTALLALCTNVAVVSLFWLNARYASGDKPRNYRIAGVEIHDRKPKSFLSRYSASLLLNTFSYGELFVEGEGYTLINVSPHIARQLSGLQGAYLKIDLADGCLGWGVVKKIYPIATVVHRCGMKPLVPLLRGWGRKRIRPDGRKRNILFCTHGETFIYLPNCVI